MSRLEIYLQAQLQNSIRTEIAVQHSLGGYKARRGVGFRARPCSLITSKKEELIATDWSSNNAAELIALERVLLDGKVVSGIHIAVTEEIEHCAMKPVRPGSGNDVDHCTRV